MTMNQHSILFSWEEIKYLEGRNDVFIQAFLSHCDIEPFESFCSLLIRGKSSSSPNKLTRRHSFEELFKSLYASSLSSSKSFSLQRTEKPLSTKLSALYLNYVDMTVALRKISQRWRCFSFDDIISIAIFMDPNRSGVVSFNDYMSFCSHISEFYIRHPLNPSENCNHLFNEFIQVSMFGNHNVNEELTENSEQNMFLQNIVDKLKDLSYFARKSNLNPLWKFFQMKSKRENLNCAEISSFLMTFGAEVEMAEGNEEAFGSSSMQVDVTEPSIKWSSEPNVDSMENPNDLRMSNGSNRRFFSRIENEARRGKVLNVGDATTPTTATISSATPTSWRRDDE